MQLAQVCLAAGRTRIARILLQDLLAEFDRRALGPWEKQDFLAGPLASLLQAMDDPADAGRDALFARICLYNPNLAAEIDPV